MNIQKPALKVEPANLGHANLSGKFGFDLGENLND